MQNKLRIIYFMRGNILGVINTRSRQVEQRTDYYPYGMPHGNASGAGLNSRKYSGKELITFAGYDAMDYHARWRPTSLPLFTTPDPMAEKRPGVSLYTYCSGDPVNKIDPDGCDEWDISPGGHIVRTVATTEHDAFFVLDEDGNRIEEKSISFDYGTVLSSHSDLNWEGEKFNVIKMRGDKNATSAFEFLASNTNVEWGHTGTGVEGPKGLNFLTTSMESSVEGGGFYLIKHQLRNGYNLRFYNHSHPGGDIYPSGLLPRGSDRKTYGDIMFARYVTSILGYTPVFNVYSPQKGKYLSFGPYSTEEDYEIDNPCIVLPDIIIKYKN